MAIAAPTMNYDLQETTFEYAVVGTGPVGVKFVQELLKLQPGANIAVFGDEPWEPYNRIQLSSLISGEIKEPSLYDNYDLTKIDNVKTFYNYKIERIDRKNKWIIDNFGNRYGYNKLILATGSRPTIPNISGTDLKNVFTFRDLNDAQRLMGRSVRTQKTVIIGGGLLGLEAARAMQRFNTEVHIIEHSSWLLFNQLDNRAGTYLKQYIESLGIYIHTSERVEKITGEDKATGVILKNDKLLECDTVIIAAGITANSELAKQSGLNYGNGIRVNDHLQTNDSNIFAIGECAEHNNKTYGLVSPGFEQASVLSHYLNDDDVNYKGSVSSTHLKVLDYPVFSIGDINLTVRERDIYTYQDHENEVYRKIVVINGRIRSAIGIGEWPGVQRFQEAVENKRRVWPWQIHNFVTDGILWNDAESENVIDWPSSATVCNCTGVTRGQLSSAVKNGACTINELACATGASTVCGSCKPLLSDFVGGNAVPEPTKFYKSLTGLSLMAFVFCLVCLLIPSYPYSLSVTQDLQLDVLWKDSLFKQISGFSLLGISILISVISLRKRVKKLSSLFDYSYWRFGHVAFGATTLLVLFTHTGFSLGNNINFYLMATFSLLLLVGTIAGAAIGYEHNLPRRLAKKIRTYAVWSHILLLWPLPALLGFHIFKTYYF